MMINKVQLLRQSVQNFLQNEIEPSRIANSLETMIDITISWDELCRMSFMESFWKEVILAPSNSRILINSEYQYLLTLFGLICELRKCHRFQQDLHVPSRLDFQCLVIRSFLTAEVFCWIEFASASVSESLPENVARSAVELSASTKRIIESFSHDAIKLFVCQLIQYLKENNLPPACTFPAVLWHCLSWQYLEKFLFATFYLSCKLCDCSTELIFTKVIGELVCRINASSGSLVELLLEYVNKFVLPKPISQFLADQIFSDNQAFGMCENLLILWSSKKFIASSTIAVYSSICDLLQFLVQKQLLQKIDNVDSFSTQHIPLDQLELFLVDGLSVVIELDMEKLEIALNMLTNICSKVDKNPPTSSFTALSGLVTSLAPIILQHTQLRTSSIVVNEESLLLDKEKQKKFQRRSQRSFLEILEELKDCASHGAESKFRQIDVLMDLEEFVEYAHDATGFSDFVGEILQTLLSLHNLSEEERLDEKLKNVLLLLTKAFPEIVLRQYCVLLHGAAGSSSDTKFSTLDVSLCIRALAMTEDAVFCIEKCSHSVNIQNYSDAQLDSQELQQNSKTRIKAPKKLAALKMSGSSSQQHYNAYYQVLINDVSLQVLDCVWYVLEQCCAQLLAIEKQETDRRTSNILHSSSFSSSIPLINSSQHRRYLIEEISVSSPSSPSSSVKFHENVDFGMAILLAQTLHSLSAILLCLSRSASSLPQIKRATFHWNMKLAHFLVETIYPSSNQQFFELGSVRRATFGALLTATERLSRSWMNNEEENIDLQDIAYVLQKIVVFIDAAMGKEKDSICKKMLVQSSGLIVMCQF